VLLKSDLDVQQTHLCCSEGLPGNKLVGATTFSITTFSITALISMVLMVQHALKNVNNCLNTHIYTFLETATVKFL